MAARVAITDNGKIIHDGNSGIYPDGVYCSTVAVDSFQPTVPPIAYIRSFTTATA